MRKKKIANGIVESQVGQALLENPSYTAPELKKVVEKELKGKGYNYRFTERTYLNIKKKLLPNLGDKPIDAPWSIGASLKYNIPDDMIPHLLELKGLQASLPSRVAIPKSSPSLYLTIRVARWFCRLYSFIEKQIEMYKPDSSEKQRLGFHYLIAGQYAEAERLSETLGKDYPDTSGLDDEAQKLDINQGFFQVFIPELADDYRLSQKRKVKHERTHNQKKQE